MQRSLQLTTFLVSLSALAPAAVAQTAPSAEQVRQQDAHSEAEWYYSVGIQNYVFALPLSIMERERKIRLDPAALEQAKKVAPAAPINQIGHMHTLATANDIMPYTPNNDTVYSGAFLELPAVRSSSPRPTSPTATGQSRSPTPTPTTCSTSARAPPVAKVATTPSSGPTGMPRCRRASPSIVSRPIPVCSRSASAFFRRTIGSQKVNDCNRENST